MEFEDMFETGWNDRWILIDGKRLNYITFAADFTSQQPTKQIEDDTGKATTDDIK